MKRRIRSWLRFLGRVLLFDLGILVGMGLLCWFADWRTWQQYAQGLIVVGVGTVAIGIFSLVGSWNLTRNFNYQQSMSTMGTMSSRASQAMQDANQNYAFIVWSTAIGVIAAAIGSLIQAAVK